jgi:hypothetical protein
VPVHVAQAGAHEPVEFFDPVPNGNLPPMPYRDMPEPLPLGKASSWQALAWGRVSTSSGRS